MAAPKHEIVKDFPFRLLAFWGDDGTPVVEIETSPDEDNEYHNSDGSPRVRVWLNDAELS